MIEAAVTEKVDGLAVSAPDPDAISSAVRQAVDAGIPVITLNSGLDSYQQLGALTHVGQTEGLAGEAAGRALKENGAKKLLCVIHEQGNIGLNDRCDGAKKGFGGDVENMQAKGTSDIQTSLTEIQSKLQADSSIDAVLALNPDIAIAARDAVKGANSKATLATFDLSGDVMKGVAGADPVRDRPAAVPAGLPARADADALQAQPEHDRRRPAGPHRAEPGDQGERRPRSRSSRRRVCADAPGGRDQAGGPAGDGQRRRRSVGRRSASRRSCCGDPSWAR